MKNLCSIILVLIVLGGLTIPQGVHGASEGSDPSRLAGRSECCVSTESLKLQSGGGTGQQNSERSNGAACDLCPSCLDVDFANQTIFLYSSFPGGVLREREDLPLLAGHTLPLLKPPQQ
jgi:hypothetical protein